jgi:hypothetical protein
MGKLDALNGWDMDVFVIQEACLSSSTAVSSAASSLVAAHDAQHIHDK